MFHEEVLAEMEQARRGKKNYFEFRHRRRDGSVRDVAVFSGTTLVQGQERLYTIVQDITDKVELEKQLYQVSYAIENAAIGVFRVDEPDGNIVYANRTACEDLGYSKEELTSRTVFDINPTFSLEQWRVHREDVKKSTAKTIETLHRRKDGSEFPVEITVSHFSYKRESYSFSFVKDITKGKETEAELVRLVENKESLLREVHHRVKNNLAVINGLIHLQLDELGDDTASRRALYKIRDRILIMGIIHNMLYHDKYISRVDFAQFLRQVVTHLHDEYVPYNTVEITFELEEAFVDVEKAVPLGLIVNEVVANALLHAFEGLDRGSLMVSLKHTGAENYTFVVQDNGVGLPASFSLENQETLGFQLISTLAKQIDADISVHGGEGTVIEIRFENN